MYTVPQPKHSTAPGIYAMADWHGVSDSAEYQTRTQSDKLGFFPLPMDYAPLCYPCSVRDDTEPGKMAEHGSLTIYGDPQCDDCRADAATRCTCAVFGQVICPVCLAKFDAKFNSGEMNRPQR
jgi:hypothetical protein